MLREILALLPDLGRDRGRQIRAKILQDRAAELTDLRSQMNDDPDREETIARWDRIRRESASWQYQEIGLAWADVLDPPDRRNCKPE